MPAPYIYKPAATRVKQGSVAANAGQSGPMRAPGHAVASLSIESALDGLAVKLGLDPVEIRLKNDPFDVRRCEYELGAEKFGWKQKYRKPGSPPGTVKVGVGCAGAAWMSGGRGTQAEIQVNSDGTVEVPVTAGGRSAYLQLAEKSDFDWALVSCAVAGRLEGGRLRGVRIALGAVAPIPWQVEAAGKFLEGREPSDENAAQAADLVLRDAAPQEHNAYKIPQARALIRRAVRKLAV